MGIYPKVPKDAKVIGPVPVQLCQAKLKDKAPTGDDALRALKVAAAQKGATALADVSFGTECRGNQRLPLDRACERHGIRAQLKSAGTVGTVLSLSLTIS